MSSSLSFFLLFSFFFFLIFPRKKKYPLVNAQQLLGPLQAGETQAACRAGEHKASVRTGDWKPRSDVKIPEEHDVASASPKEQAQGVKTRAPAAEKLGGGLVPFKR